MRSVMSSEVSAIALGVAFATALDVQEDPLWSCVAEDCYQHGLLALNN